MIVYVLINSFIYLHIVVNVEYVLLNKYMIVYLMYMIMTLPKLYIQEHLL